MGDYTPTRADRFTFGLWTVGNIGRDPFGDAVRPRMEPTHAVRKLAELGAMGVNLHDNDLVPIDASAGERDRIVREFKQVLADTGMSVPMATTNLFFDPVFKDGAFTSSSPAVRAYAVQKSMRAMELGAELGAKVYVFWGGREGTETDAARDPRDGIKWCRECMNFLADFSEQNSLGLRFAIEPKPNEPRGDIYMPTVGSALAFIATLQKPHMFGVNPEYAHETMAGLNFVHAVGQALEAGKLFHIDLNGQKMGRYDQDFRFGAEDLKANFFLVKLLEDCGYSGSLHFDAHPYRTEDDEGVWDFARGCMRTYLILKEKAARWNADAEIQGILAAARRDDDGIGARIRAYSPDNAAAIGAHNFDRSVEGRRGYAYERLDQLTVELLLGVR